MVERRIPEAERTSTVDKARIYFCFPCEYAESVGLVPWVDVRITGRKLRVHYLQFGVTPEAKPE
jgi:hypothetical protein